MPAKKSTEIPPRARKAKTATVAPPRSERLRRPTRKAIEKTINRYMDEAHCSLYGRAFDISPAGDRDAAVAWFADFFQDIDKRLR